MHSIRARQATRKGIRVSPIQLGGDADDPQETDGVRASRYFQLPAPKRRHIIVRLGDSCQ